VVDKIDVKLVGPWRRFAKSLTKREWERNFAREAGRATRINALIARRAIRTAIRSAQSHGQKSAGLTAAIKGNDRPLWQSGYLHGSVSTRIDAWHTATVGILRTAGPDLVSVAATIHNGAKRKITDPMRGLFAALHAVSIGRMEVSALRSSRIKTLWHWFSRNAPGQVWPSLANKTHIVISGRPFILWAVESSEMTKVPVNYMVAAIRAFIIPGVSKGAPKYVH